MARLPRTPIADISLSGEAPGAIEPAGMNAQAPLARASFAGKMADILNARSEKMQQQRDVLDSITARNEYRDSLRNLKVDAFAKKQGKDADQSLYKQHQVESDKIKTDISNKLTKGGQMRFLPLAQTEQDSHLDQMSNYIVRENEQYKVDTLKGSILSAEEKVRSDVNSFDKERDMVFAQIDTLRPGMDNREPKIQVDRQLRSAQIESMVDSDPAIAKDYLEKNKEKIGQEIYAKYSNFIDKQVEAKFHEFTRVALNNEAAAKEFAVNTVSGLIREGKFVEALKFIDKNDQLDQDEKLKLETSLDYKMQTGKDPFNESNPAYASALFKKAANGGFTDDEILRIIPIAGTLSRQDAQIAKSIAIGVLKESSTGYASTLQMAMSSIEKQITRDNELIKDLPEVVEWNYIAQNELIGILKDEKDQAKRADMLNPRSEHYIIPKIIAPYIRKSLDEQIKLKLDKFNEATGVAPEEDKPSVLNYRRWIGQKTQPVQPVKPKSIKRIPGETIDAWKKRTGQ